MFHFEGSIKIIRKTFRPTETSSPLRKKTSSPFSTNIHPSERVQSTQEADDHEERVIPAILIGDYRGRPPWSRRVSLEETH